MQEYIESEFERLTKGMFPTKQERATALQYVKLGWRMCEKWEEEQAEMDKDYQEDMNQNRELAEGKG